MRDYNLRIGNVVITLGFRREADMRLFSEYFRRPSHPHPGKVRLDLKFKDGYKGLAEVPSSLFLTKVVGEKGFTAGGGLVSGRFSSGSGEGELVVQRILTRNGFMRVFEQILYQAYWSAVILQGLDSLLLHSSCVIRNGRGYVFCGKSGSGKSTIASMLSEGKVLNDEISVIDLGREPATLFDAPFNGFFTGKEEGSAPLAGIYLLKQAPYHRVARTSTAESIKILSREIIPPMGLDTPLAPKIYLEMLDIATRIAEAVPLYTLEFLPDRGFWACIDQAEGER